MFSVVTVKGNRDLKYGTTSEALEAASEFVRDTRSPVIVKNDDVLNPWRVLLSPLPSKLVEW